MKLLDYLLFPPVFFFSEKKLNKSIQGKTILITGASFGIGEAVAQQLAGVGVTLILTARTQEKLEQLQIELHKKGATVHIFALDLTDKVAVGQWLEQLKQTFKIDIIISNAGKSIRRPIYESLNRLHDFERTMALNYFAPVQLSLALIPMLEQQKGQLINISAINVLLPAAPYWAAYQASKSAFDQWWKSATPELNAKGITTTAIYLPLVRTRMIAPTKIYDHVPAMSSQQVAKIIAKKIYTQSRQFKPWWLFLGQWAGLAFGWIWYWGNRQWLKNK